jgi:hypothetical protein
VFVAKQDTFTSNSYYEEQPYTGEIYLALDEPGHSSGENLWLFWEMFILVCGGWLAVPT